MAFACKEPCRSPCRLTVTRRRSPRHSPQPRFRARLTRVIVTPLLSPLICPRSRRLSVNAALTPLSFTPTTKLIKRRRQLPAPPRPASRTITPATPPRNKAAQARRKLAFFAEMKTACVGGRRVSTPLTRQQQTHVIKPVPVVAT